MTDSNTNPDIDPSLDIVFSYSNYSPLLDGDSIRLGFIVDNGVCQRTLETLVDKDIVDASSETRIVELGVKQLSKDILDMCAEKKKRPTQKRIYTDDYKKIEKALNDISNGSNVNISSMIQDTSL